MNPDLQIQNKKYTSKSVITDSKKFYIESSFC